MDGPATQTSERAGAPGGAPSRPAPNAQRPAERADAGDRPAAQPDAVEQQDAPGRPAAQPDAGRTPVGGRFSRRALLGRAAIGAAAVGLGGAGFAAGRASTTPASEPAAAPGPAPGAASYPFTGRHQAGIVTPAQDRMHFASWDVTTDDREQLVALLRDWTVAASRMVRGLPAGEFGPDSGPYDAPPDDTGEAMDLPAAGLTLTFGVGPSLFTDGNGDDRFGVADRRPAALIDLPHFPGDVLEQARSGGDICVQACADDPQVAVHAIRNLSRIAFGRAAIRWAQLGYGRTSSTSTAQRTPRNLFGFKDGTNNVKAEQRQLVDQQIWADGGDGAAWMAGGTYLIARRIRMTIETWDRTTLREQEALIGRTKGAGAPLSGGEEFTALDFEATGRDDQPLIPTDSHVRLSHPSHNDGAVMVRRGYNFTDGNDKLGRLDAGLFFIAFVRDPGMQFVPIQNKLARDDAMSEYIRHTGSGIWAVPPGVPSEQALADGAYVGQDLFA